MDFPGPGSMEMSTDEPRAETNKGASTEPGVGPGTGIDCFTGDEGTASEVSGTGTGSSGPGPGPGSGTGNWTVDQEKDCYLRHQSPEHQHQQG